MGHAVPKDDYYLSMMNVECKPMVKAANATAILGCDLEPKQQVSKVLAEPHDKHFELLGFIFAIVNHNL